MLSSRLVGDESGRARCAWGAEPDLYRAYHDTEWGWAVTDDRRLLEKLCLEGFQAGLSWLTILRKREAFRAAFAGFDAQTVAGFDESDVQRLLADADIVRHRGKIESAINNARRALELVAEYGSLARFVADYRPGPASRPGHITWEWLAEHPTSAESTALAKELKRRGWTFVGPTTVHAFMQSVGLVNDHLDGCWVRADAEASRSAWDDLCGPAPRVTV